ncbi:MAG TPA: ABC transporter ATP-binding protein [Dehalococcoidia bacterium]|nr:ABC transporter ATP-binding protein [Dehalococcoidia bacterium]
MTSKPSIEFQNVKFSYGKREIFQNLSFTVERGQICGILGANGAGKTTAMQLLIGLLKADNGSITVLGEKLGNHNLHRIGYMPQLNALYQELSVEENLNFFARMYGMTNRQERAIAVDKALELIELDERRIDSVSNLSGGMRQRVSLGVALVHSPDVLILDEPTVGLDPQLRALFWDHFTSLSNLGITILISSHTMDDANHCQRLMFVQEGKIVADGTPGELRTAVGLAEATLEDAFLYFVNVSKGSG